jgi:hypothetical protein
MKVPRLAVLAVAVGALAGGLLTASPVLASTPGCTAGAYAGYCGTQADNAALVLVIDARGRSAAYGNPVIGWTNSSSDPGTDWFQLAYKGNPALGVMFQFAPGGTLTNMCASDPGNGFIVERPCNGSNFQRWVAAQEGSSGFFTWTNRATHKLLTAHGKGDQLVDLAPLGIGSQLWRFST